MKNINFDLNNLKALHYPNLVVFEITAAKTTHLEKKFSQLFKNRVVINLKNIIREFETQYFRTNLADLSKIEFKDYC